MISTSMSVAFEQFVEVRANVFLQILSSQDERGIMNKLQFTLELSFVKEVTVTEYDDSEVLLANISS